MTAWIDILTWIPYGMMATLFVGVILGLYTSLVNVVAMSLVPKKKYQETTTRSPSVTVWVGSIFVLVSAVAILAIRVLGRRDWALGTWVRTFFVVFAFVIMVVTSSFARQNIHIDDPYAKLSVPNTIINITAACIPIMITVLGSSGVASVIAPGQTGLFPAMVLMCVLCLPCAIGATLVMLFARPAQSANVVYGTLAVIGGLLTVGGLVI